MKFWLQTPGTMAIDNCLLSGLSFPGLPSDIYMVFWDGVTNKGEIEYADAMPVRTPFADPSPYLPYVNAWITKGATATPPLNLAQAKSVKQDVVETLFHYKRQLPIAVSDVGATFSATDEDAASMNRYLASYTTISTNNVVAQLTNDLNAKLGSFTTNINGQFDYLRSDLNDKLNRVSTVSGTASSGTFSGSGSGSGDAPAEGGEVSVTVDVSGVTSATTVTGKCNFATIVQPVVTQPVVLTPVVNYPPYLYWVPLGYTAAVAFTLDQFCQILAAIEERRANLNSTRLTKRNAIAALNSIAAVAAYNVTSGW